MIHIDGKNLKDEFGRTLMLRGVNLGGTSKVPAHPNGATYLREGFFDHRTVSFVGRPFPLSEADEHFCRLRRWGLTCLRLLVPWEAIEHAGPGIYDEEYLEYITELVKTAGGYGFSIIVDAHQDVWSRFTGGDGAPGWTLDAVGFDMTHFQQTGAAIVHATHGDPFPQMIWPTNGAKLAAGTMFTLFFAGNDFAPKTKIAGEPVQTFLQGHFLKAYQALAERLVGFDHVLGYDTINEPMQGFIGWNDLAVPGGSMLLGECPSPYQAMLLGEGHPQEVGVWEMKIVSLKRTGSRCIDPRGQRAWKEGAECIWREHGVWDYDRDQQPRLLRPDYFARVDGREVSFSRDYYVPFARKFAAGIHEVDPKAMIFTEGEPGGWPPLWIPEKGENLVYAPHWYDAFVLVKKSYSPFVAVDRCTEKPVWFPWNIRRSFASQFAYIKQGAVERMAGAPVIVEEFGIPFDLNHKRGYLTGDFRTHETALDRSFQALDANLLSAIIWNYTLDNTNLHGDQWNDEDLSIFSKDQQEDPTNLDSGGRALAAFVRPYPLATAGEPLRLSYRMSRRVLNFEFRHDAGISAPTEIFLPAYAYSRGCRIEVSDGRYELDKARQVLTYWHSPDREEHTILVLPAG